jgi:MraZ protein
MLLGKVVYKVGQKHRLALPKLFRQQLGDHIIVTRGYEGCLVIVSIDQWQALTAEVDQSSFLDIQVRQSARFLFGGAAEVDLDSQGRFIVPAVLYDHAQLAEEVVFVGLGRWVEVWHKQRWEEQIGRLAVEGAGIAQHLIRSEKPNQQSE